MSALIAVQQQRAQQIKKLRKLADHAAKEYGVSDHRY